ncbi:unnamed protein product [Durusdinium trenchii]|uniref:TIR domain-containing protein n=1 Tax=Durusdinium trenchii TaxID=1381693 RepID=A0ABP0JVC0_9DINO
MGRIVSMSKSKNPKGLLEIRVPWMAPKTRKDHVPLRRGRCSTSGRVLDLSLPTSRDLQGYSWKLFILRAGQSGCTLVAQTAPENSGATGCAVDHNRLGARFAMDVDVTFDGSPGRVRFSTPRNAPVLPILSRDLATPRGEADLDKLSRDATALSEDLDDLRSKIRRMDVPKLAIDVQHVQPLGSQWIPSANTDFSVLASSVLNDKVNSFRHDLATETWARISGDEDTCRRLLKLEQVHIDLDRRLRAWELERDQVKKETPKALRLMREEIAEAKKDIEEKMTKMTEDAALALKNELKQEIEKDLQEKMATKAQGMENAEGLKQEIDKVKKDLEEKMARKDADKLKSELEQQIGKVQEDLKDDFDQVVFCEDSLWKSLQRMQRKRDRAKEFIKQKKYEEAKNLQKEVWDACKDLKLKEDDRMTIEAQHQYATTLQLQRKFTDAEPLQQEVLKVAEGKFKDDPLTLEAMHNLACTLWHLGRLPEAKILYEKVVQKYKHAKQDDLAQQCQKDLEAIRNGKSAEDEGAEVRVAPRGPTSGSQKKHVMLSGRFNNDNILAYIKDVKAELKKQNIDVFMVEKGTGEEYAGATMWGMYNAKAMVIFGTDEYGAKTGAQYETYYELQYAHQEKIFLIPLQLGEEWPPKPTDKDGGNLGAIQNFFVLRPTILKLEDIKMEKAVLMAQKIAEAVRRHDKEEEEAKGSPKQQASSVAASGPSSVAGPGEEASAGAHLKQEYEAAQKELKDLRELIQKTSADMESERTATTKQMDALHQEFDALKKITLTSKDVEEKTDKIGGQLQNLIQEAQKANKDETRAVSTRLDEEVKHLQAEVQKREALATDTRESKAQMERRMDQVEQQMKDSMKQTSDQIDSHRRRAEALAASQEELQQQARQARASLTGEVRELGAKLEEDARQRGAKLEEDARQRGAKLEERGAKLEDDVRHRIKGSEEKLQNALDEKAKEVKTELNRRSEEQERKLRQEIQGYSERSDDIKRDLKASQDRVAEVEHFIQRLKCL